MTARLATRLTPPLLSRFDAARPRPESPASHKHAAPRQSAIVKSSSCIDALPLPRACPFLNGELTVALATDPKAITPEARGRNTAPRELSLASTISAPAGSA